MNSLTFLTLLACFFWGYFTGWYGKLSCRDEAEEIDWQEGAG